MTRAPTGTRRHGAIIGLAVGSIAALLGLIAGQMWLFAAAPAGAASGATAVRWIRRDRPIPIRAVLVPTLVATVVGSYSIVIALAFGDALRSGDLVDIVPNIVGLGIMALAFAGIPAFIAITPFAWVAAILLRRRLATIHSQ